MVALARFLGITPLTPLGAIGFGVTASVVVVCLAALAHHLIEVPGRRLVRGWQAGAGSAAAVRPSLS